jgi:hypothetical protein
LKFFDHFFISSEKSHHLFNFVAQVATEKTVDKFPKLRAWKIHELKKE